MGAHFDRARQRFLGVQPRVDAWLLRTLPATADAEDHRRARILVALVAVFVAVLLFGITFDSVGGAWRSAGLQVFWGSVAVAALLAALRRGKIREMSHFLSAILVVNLGLMAEVKGGLVTTEIAWQCAAIVFATLVVGGRGAFIWTLVAMAELVVHVYRFDPSAWHGRPVSFASPAAYAFDLGVLYFTTWGLAFAFSRARDVYFRRLEMRNEEMRRLLDHAGDAFLTIDRDGRLGVERSKCADELLGAPAAGRFLWDVLAEDPSNAERAQFVELAWQSLLDGFLPPEVVLDQFPRRVVFRGRTLDLSVTPIEGRAAIKGALVVLRDATEKLARERAEQARREVLAVFEHVRSDPSAGVDLAIEMDRLVESVVSGQDPVVVKRDLHTIKGNAGLVGLERLATLCHEIETRSQEAERALPRPDDRALLRERWAEAADELAEWIARLDGRDLLSVTRADLRELRRELTRASGTTQIDALVARLALSPVDRALDRLARQGEALAKRLGREVGFHVDVSPPNLRADAERLGPVFSSLAHAIRNALDHGFAGGAAPGTIALRASVHAATNELVLEVSDDGRGIDWNEVRRKCGRASATSTDLVDVLCHDGFSTRDSATVLSGRGVGLAGIRQAVVHLGGQLAIDSTEGKGTCVRLRVPLATEGRALAA